MSREEAQKLIAEGKVAVLSQGEKNIAVYKTQEFRYLCEKYPDRPTSELLEMIKDTQIRDTQPEWANNFDFVDRLDRALVIEKVRHLIAKERAEAEKWRVFYNKEGYKVGFELGQKEERARIVAIVKGMMKKEEVVEPNGNTYTRHGWNTALTSLLDLISKEK